MTQDQEKLFVDAGLEPTDHIGILSLILANPDAVALNLTVEGMAHVIAECACRVPPDRVAAMLMFVKLTPPSLGAMLP
jgi:hypothetical protein